MKPLHFALPLLAAALLLASCERAPQIDRAGKLLAMAGEEAAGIPNTLDRFTRQLNIADTQLRTDRKADAAKTLALARDTLAASKKEDFDDFHRIAGWTAISQLGRAAKDRDLALKASDNALAALNGVQPVIDRPKYVLSLAGELADLRGKPAAIELLESGSGWASEMKEPTARRLALVTFAQALLSYDAFDNARNTLRRDPEAAWRTDTFLTLANQNAPLIPDAYYANARTPQSAATAPTVAAVGARSGRGGFGGGAGGAAASDAALHEDSQADFQRQMQKASAWSQDVRFENVYKQSQ